MKTIPGFNLKIGFSLFLLVNIHYGPLFAQNEPSAADWPGYNRTYNGDRYSPLKQITTANVSKMHLLHSFDLGNDVASLQTGMVVVDVFQSSKTGMNRK